MVEKTADAQVTLRETVREETGLAHYLTVALTIAGLGL